MKIDCGCNNWRNTTLNETIVKLTVPFVQEVEAIKDLTEEALCQAVATDTVVPEVMDLVTEVIE